ncbi:MAG: EamA family transporter RarD [Chloroflexota bacterium]
MNKGVLYAISAYTTWGILPLFWKLLQDVPAIETLGHRTIWSLVFVVGLLAYKQDWSWLASARKNPKAYRVFLLSALLVGSNWLIFIWAVNAGYVVEASLGYFINPLLSVVMGVVFLKERLRRNQWLAVFIAFLGVVYLTISVGSPPWIALSLAGTFGIYGLIRKTAPLGSIHALGFETAILTPIALTYFIFIESSGAGHFFSSWQTAVLFALSGAFTAIPLLLFGAGARLINLSTIGILQYIAPTLQFLIGLFIFQEPFTQSQLIGYSIIWCALLIYALDGVRNGRLQPKLAS